MYILPVIITIEVDYIFPKTAVKVLLLKCF